jgi:hypothetical protein
MAVLADSVSVVFAATEHSPVRYLLANAVTAAESALKAATSTDATVTRRRARKKRKLTDSEKAASTATEMTAVSAPSYGVKLDVSRLQALGENLSTFSGPALPEPAGDANPNKRKQAPDAIVPVANLTIADDAMVDEGRRLIKRCKPSPMGTPNGDIFAQHAVVTLKARTADVLHRESTSSSSSSSSSSLPSDPLPSASTAIALKNKPPLPGQCPFENAVSAVERCSSLSFIVDSGLENVDAAKAVNAIRLRHAELPLYSVAHETELLQEAGTFKHPRNDSIVVYPACTRGYLCVGKTEDLAGMPSSEGVVLMQAMTPEELQHLMSSGVAPVEKGPCVLCTRWLICSALIVSRSINTTVGAASPQILNAWRVVVGTGGYEARNCLMPMQHFGVCITDPVVMFRRSCLKAHKCSQSGRVFISQTDMLHVGASSSISSTLGLRNNGLTLRDFC